MIIYHTDHSISLVPFEISVFFYEKLLPVFAPSGSTAVSAAFQFHYFTQQ